MSNVTATDISKKKQFQINMHRKIFDNLITNLNMAIAV